MSEVAHPSPHRERTSFWALMFGCCTAPIFWLGQLILSYWVTAEVCYHGDHPTVTGTPVDLQAALYAFDTVAVAAALAGAAVSYLCWQATRDEKGSGANQALHIGEGRARFMALWGMFASLCFFVGIIFATIASLTVPLCTP